MSARLFMITGLVLALGAGCALFSDGIHREPAQVTVSALKAFRNIHSVAIGDRCTNCHAPGGIPMQLSGGARRRHSMNVQRSIEGLGLRCTSCHQDHNLDQAHSPPGAANWRMPHEQKAYTGAISAHDLCRLWLDPARNHAESGDEKPRTPEDLLEHVTHDPLVKWTWNPGPGVIPSVGTHEKFVENFEVWVKGGSPCPEEEKTHD